MITGCRPLIIDDANSIAADGCQWRHYYFKKYAEKATV